MTLIPQEISAQFKTAVEDASRVAKRRQQLALASIALFSRLGYHSATVKDIAEEAGVSPGLIYQYVSDKQDLLFLALLHITHQNKKEIPEAIKDLKDPFLRLNAAIEAYAHVIAANADAVMLTYRESKSLKREHIEQMKKLELDTNYLIEQCVQECIDAGLLHQTHVELLVYRIIIGTHAWDLKHWRLSKLMSLRQYLDGAVHPCWRHLLTPKGRRKLGALIKQGALRQ